MSDQLAKALIQIKILNWSFHETNCVHRWWHCRTCHTKYCPFPRLKELGYDIQYIGSYDGIEKKLIADYGIPLLWDCHG